MVISSETFIDVKSGTTVKQLIEFLEKVPPGARVDVEEDPMAGVNRINVSWNEIKP